MKLPRAGGQRRTEAEALENIREAVAGCLDPRASREQGVAPLARRPLSECPFRLTAAEKKLLKDPDWIDEEEAADLILAMRDEKKSGAAGGANIRDFARQLGIPPLSRA